MSTGQMLPGPYPVDDDLVRRLIARQFPQWADMRVECFPSGGTVNAMYRLGDSMVVRLPLTDGGAKDAVLEQEWLPLLATRLPTTIPELLGAGKPVDGYPWPWSVYRWLAGESSEAGALSEPVLLAKDLAEFIAAMREITLPGAPQAHRGGSLASLDTSTRAAIEELRGIPQEGVDCDAAAAVWDEALRASYWCSSPVWLHADLMPGNLLVRGGRLTSVIDFGCIGMGDPACDLIPAWNLPADRCTECLPRRAGRGRRNLAPRPGTDALAGADRSTDLPENESNNGAERPARDPGGVGRGLRPPEAPPTMARTRNRRVQKLGGS